MVNSDQTVIFAVVFLAGRILSSLVLPSYAEPLEKWDCKTFEEERIRLEKAGIKNKMSRGAQWAQENLDPSALEQIRQFIIVSEQLKFRCPTKSLDVAKNKKNESTAKKKKK